MWVYIVLVSPLSIRKCKENNTTIKRSSRRRRNSTLRLKKLRRKRWVLQYHNTSYIVLKLCRPCALFVMWLNLSSLLYIMWLRPCALFVSTVHMIVYWSQVMSPVWSNQTTVETNSPFAISNTVPITTDTLLFNALKLDIKETNWTIFCFCFQVVVEAKELWFQFDGSSTLPTMPTIPTATETTALNKWHMDKSLAKHLPT